MLCTWVWWKLLTWVLMFSLFLSAAWQGNTSPHPWGCCVGWCLLFQRPRVLKEVQGSERHWLEAAWPCVCGQLERGQPGRGCCPAGSTREALSADGHFWCAGCHTACRNCSVRDLQFGQTCTDPGGNSGKPILNLSLSLLPRSNLNFKASSNLGY